ncbi:peptide-methionine (S)-S-oxide reductase MsrA [Mucilaginibacter ginsenosidivorax]|uniref:Peptide methionine sulfoxide reductase MsrA n=1 Tax=Mucilaginibacter ginsenosidivorax TaxID=862126 RepID=A0A5B8VW20_9SPHI|nr:peptide-methionine (S)-S-oxide reductase MsrA [Mucilaginibacter ginsenosidivorax]QEC75874.1 peptide-methionine (S)-S-oxide reductase MsrA [Mucilaginibacter ginsenosidivorax]
MPSNIQKITFGNGCFWCTEAIFQSLKGVISVTSGYMGGHVDNPTYKQVCTGTTGHAEVIELEYDADVLSLDELLLFFFKTHNPTTLNRQGNDVGTQYRSAIFYTTAEQKDAAIAMINTLTNEKVFDSPIVTEVTPASQFYKAEDYHQNYFNDNPGQSYCAFVIQPKLNKFAKEFTDKIKPELL